MERHFANQRGLNREDDRLPLRGQLLGFEDALDAYYDARGWHNDGTASNMAQSD
ncbi:aldehyde ferredoxin oxidoreductase C-terminal domain-containing protein [Halobacterium sp. KA-4]|uniref:aldehyde ferredoxin oxidoreductase C-terminal domain-containing protein n=1 Tax=Halobacterium sp. KA-4 TaxID=2896367 RepID=UPI001E3DD462